jgi:hypothetical protein
MRSPAICQPNSAQSCHRCGIRTTVAALLGVAFAATATILSIATGPDSPKSTEKPAPTNHASAPTSTPVAVVELFTSEGCSSCPPAEAVLSDFINREWPGDVIALSFHVDYWDKLGWPDRYASAAATARQHDYAQTLRLTSLYTPQMIVNGQTEFVGSDRDRAQRAVSAALAHPPALNVTGSSTHTSPGTPIEIEINAPSSPNDATALVAFIESGLVVKVERGENAGRTLTHDAVVRTFTTTPLNHGKASVKLLPPEGANPSASAIVIVVQDAQRRVLGAARL